MLIEIEAAGICLDVGKTSQRAGCAVVLICEDNYKRKARRVISTPLGSISQPQAEIQSAILGLDSVAERFRSQAIVTLRCTNYVYKALERDNGLYKIKPQKNTDLIKRLRAIYECFGNVTLVLEDRDGLEEAAKTAREVASLDSPLDTGTRMCTNE